LKSHFGASATNDLVYAGRNYWSNASDVR